MAKFWENLKYHEDTIAKRPITNEEIQFLTELQKEMNTQDNLGQADPRYWVIRDFAKAYGNKLNNYDGVCIYDPNACVTICEIENGAFGSLEDITLRVLKAFDELGYELSKYDREAITRSYDTDYLIDKLEELDFSVLQYQIVPNYSGFFLTQKAAEKHLRKNYYHYDDNATTYAMTAWRSKEADMLYKILHEVDFSKLKREG